MNKTYQFEAESIKKIQLADYAEDEFAVARMGFLSTRPNAHNLLITEELLRANAPSVLGKWLVVDMTGLFDAGTHTAQEHIVGRVPEEQEVEFIEDDDGYLRAYVDVVVSKIYAKEFIKIFDDDNIRAVSVEMKVETPEDDENDILSFKILGVTVLGKRVRPSCPQSDITFVRFSSDEADNFYNQVHKDSLAALRKFSKERQEAMAETKTYKIDKSKEAMSNDAWGDVDKTVMRNKILEASNASTLVKSVYLEVGSDWKERPSEALKYPVMQLKGDTFVYNRNALSSAKAYAEQNDESSVISKLNKIYKKLDLDEPERKEDTKKMSMEINFAAVNIGDMWCKLWEAMRERHEWDYEIFAIYEEDNQKFALLKDKDGKMYRWNFSLTEDEGLVGADEIIELEWVETDSVKKFAEPENVADYRFAEPDKDEDEGDEDDDDKDDDKDDEDEDDETKMARMAADIEDRDNIIMEKDKQIAEMEAELLTLRTFKEGVEKKELAQDVDTVLAKVTGCMSEDKVKELRTEGLSCTKESFAAFANKVKAMAFDANEGKTTAKTETGTWSFAAPVEQVKKKSLWD